MVASASSSNTQWPSGCCRSISARVADAMQRSDPPGAPAGGGATDPAASGVRRRPCAWRAARLGRGMARAHGAFERRRQAGRGPIAGEEQVPPLRRGGRPTAFSAGVAGKGRAPLPHDLPRRHVARDPGHLRQPPARWSCARSMRGMSISRSALLIVTDSRPGNANIHSVVAFKTRGHRRDRRPARRSGSARWRCCDRRSAPRSPGSSMAAACAGTASTTASAGPSVTLSPPKSSALDAVAGKAQRAQLVLEPDRRRCAPRDGAAPAR